MYFSYKKRLLSFLFCIWFVMFYLNFDIGVWVGEQLGFFNWVENFSVNNNNLFYLKLSENISDPQSALIMGVSLGSDRIQNQLRFNDIMRASGMTHAIVASGYNINLVYNLILRLLGSEYRLINLILAQVFALIYAFLAGFNIPIVRAIIMVSVIKWHCFLGYKNSSFFILLYSALLILFISPSQVTSLSFWYSFLATFGLLLLGLVPKDLIKNMPIIILETLFAQLFIIPLTYIIFGTFNFVSFLSNIFLSSFIPLITLLGLFNFLLIRAGFNSSSVFEVILNCFTTLFIYICDKLPKLIVPPSLNLVLMSTLIAYLGTLINYVVLNDLV